MTKNTTTTTDLNTTIIETLVETGCLPMDTDFETELGLTARDQRTLDWFAGKGWDGALRLEADCSDTGWATLVRWSEDYGIQLLTIDRNGCIAAEATLTYNAIGARQLAALLAA